MANPPPLPDDDWNYSAASWPVFNTARAIRQRQRDARQARLRDRQDAVRAAYVTPAELRRERRAICERFLEENEELGLRQNAWWRVNPFDPELGSVNRLQIPVSATNTKARNQAAVVGPAPFARSYIVTVATEADGSPLLCEHCRQRPALDDRRVYWHRLGDVVNLCGICERRRKAALVGGPAFVRSRPAPVQPSLTYKPAWKRARRTPVYTAFTAATASTSATGAATRVSKLRRLSAVRARALWQQTTRGIGALMAKFMPRTTPEFEARQFANTTVLAAGRAWSDLQYVYDTLRSRLGPSGSFPSSAWQRNPPSPPAINNPQMAQVPGTLPLILVTPPTISQPALATPRPLPSWATNHPKQFYRGLLY